MYKLAQRSVSICWLLAGITCLRAAEYEVTDGEQLRRKAGEIHRRALTLDSHVDIAGTHYATESLDPGTDHPRLRCDLVKMAAGGLDGVFLAAWIKQGKCEPEAYRRAHTLAIKKAEAIRRLATMHPDRCELATSPDDVLRIAKTGKRVIIMAVENRYPIGTDLSNLQAFFDLGARYVTLCHNGHNQICDSAIASSRLGDKPARHNGLSDFGRRVVARMNRLGIMVDVSHLSRKSFYDVIEASGAPIIASHSGCRAVRDHPRNLDDRQLKALAAGGGVIQVVAVGSFLRTKSSSQQPAATIRDYVDHIDHAVKTAGIDHVGIGSDFDGGGGVPGFNNHAESVNVTVELLRRGYGEEDIRKIWGGNLLRVWREVEKVAAQLRQSGRQNGPAA